MPVAIAKRSFFGDAFCGDQGGCWANDGKVTLCLADGLGHGEDAEEAAQAALDYVAGHCAASLAELFAGCDEALYRTRGAAVGIAVIDHEAGTLIHAGVGNTRAVVVGDKTAHLGSTTGIVGGRYRRLSPETVPFMPGDLVVMVTDGIKQRFNFANVRKVEGADVQGLAEKIVEDWGRETDDAAVLVFRGEIK